MINKLKKMLKAAADVKWSNDAAFPPNNTLDGSEQFPGLKDGDNFKTELEGGILPYVQENTTTDQIQQGANHFFLTDDNYSTDNLDSAPNFSDLKTETDDHIADLSNPHETTLQQAYNQNSSVLLDDGDITFTNSTSGVVESKITSASGTQSHYPVFYFTNGQSVTLTTDALDTVYSNANTTSGSNSIAIQLESTPQYANNGSFYVYSPEAQATTVNAASGVTLNGADGGSLTIAESALIKFQRVASNTWVSIVQTIAAGSGLTLNADGTLNLTGTGPSAGYGYVSIKGTGSNAPINESPTSFTATNRYLIPWSVNTVFVNDTNNLAPYFSNATPGSNCLAGIENISLEAGVYEITFMPAIRYSTANTNPGSTDYFFSANLNMTGDGAGAFVPINPISSSGGYNSGSDLPFTVYPNYIASPLTYSVQVTLAPGDKIFPAYRSASSTDASNNSTVMNSLIISAKKLGDVGGATAGVTSFDGMTGDVSSVEGNRILITQPLAGDIRFDYLGQRSGSVVASPSSDYTITNPCPAVVTLTPDGSGYAFILPSVIASGETNLLNVGDSLTLINASTEYYALLQNGNLSTNVTLLPDTKTTITLTDNSTTAGTWLVSSEPQFSAISVSGVSDPGVQLWPNIRYFLTSTGDFTLPPSTFVSEGDIIEIIAINGATFNILQNNDQAIVVGTESTNIGTSGYLQAEDPNCSIRLIAQDSLTFYALGAPQGNFTGH